MNVTRVVVLGVAALAAGGAALIVRSMIGGAPPDAVASTPPPVITSDVLVASTTVPPGRPLQVGSVRWDPWPKTSVSDAFITRDEQPEMAKAVESMIVRSPLVAGQPITPLNTVRSDVTGFLAATLMPGMRAVAMPVEANTGAGGFLLPNDRVDVILTHDVSGGNGGDKVWRSDTIIEDVRLLAIDQTATPESAPPPAPAGGAAAAPNTDSKVGKVATLELTARQAEILHRARAVGSLYLTLRSLGDSDGRASVGTTAFGGAAAGPTHLIIRYGITRDVGKKPGS
jgi:pilus assembly protein CpaB